MGNITVPVTKVTKLTWKSAQEWKFFTGKRWAILSHMHFIQSWGFSVNETAFH